MIDLKRLEQSPEVELDKKPKKGKNKWVIMAKFTGESECDECISDILEIARKQEIDMKADKNGYFQCPVNVFHYHSRHGCPHEGLWKGKLLLKSIYV